MKSANIAVTAADLIVKELLMPLSSKKPVNRRDIVPAIAAAAKPTPICVAERFI